MALSTSLLKVSSVTDSTAIFLVVPHDSAGQWQHFLLLQPGMRASTCQRNELSRDMSVSATHLVADKSNESNTNCRRQKMLGYNVTL